MATPLQVELPRALTDAVQGSGEPVIIATSVGNLAVVKEAEMQELVAARELARHQGLIQEALAGARQPLAGARERVRARARQISLERYGH